MACNQKYPLHVYGMMHFQLQWVSQDQNQQPAEEEEILFSLQEKNQSMNAPPVGENYDNLCSEIYVNENVCRFNVTMNVNRNSVLVNIFKSSSRIKCNLDSGRPRQRFPTWEQHKITKIMVYQNVFSGKKIREKLKHAPHRNRANVESDCHCQCIHRLKTKNPRHNIRLIEPTIIYINSWLFLYHSLEIYTETRTL